MSEIAKGVEHRSQGRVRKAQCGETRMLRLEGGKGRKALPIPTQYAALTPLQESRSVIDAVPIATNSLSG
jgi:hypothetical protein